MWIVNIEEANLYWARGEINIAKQLMRTLLYNLQLVWNNSYSL